ncbi:MAG: UbiA family prenyltransferase [Solirubrobacterales bacterium]
MSHRRNFGAPLSQTRDGTDIPLVVDLDGTLTPSDLLIESVFHLVAAHPLSLLRLPLWLLMGKAAFKARIADQAALDLKLLPLNEDLLALVRAEKARGRRIYLASASDRRYVEALADHLGLFDGVFASNGATNLSGREKARVLTEAFGLGGFDYAANSEVDLAVWERARKAILVDVPAKVGLEARRRCADVHEIGASRPWREKLGGYRQALRLHQWLKNILVFLPALADHSLDPATLGRSALACLAFCLCASSVYLLNDLIDLPNDRLHPTKCNRPFACGALPLAHGLGLIPLLLAATALVALALPGAFAGVLGLYYVVTVLYSLTLKRRIVVDVLTLAGLYTLRVLGGAAATGIAVSQWLLAFSMFLFLCLALIKRYSELVERMRSNKPKAAGRGYLTDDSPMVGALAGASGFASILVLALYINSPDVGRLYTHPEALWGICLLLLYWVSRVLMLAHRGELHEDPVVFAATDRTSLLTVALMGVVAIAGSLP